MMSPRSCTDCGVTYQPRTGTQKRCAPCKFRRDFPDGISRDLVLTVFGPSGQRLSRTHVWTPGSLRRRGRMAESDPGEWLAPVLSLPNRAQYRSRPRRGTAAPHTVTAQDAS